MKQWRAITKEILESMYPYAIMSKDLENYHGTLYNLMDNLSENHPNYVLPWGGYLKYNDTYNNEVTTSRNAYAARAIEDYDIKEPSSYSIYIRGNSGQSDITLYEDDYRIVDGSQNILASTLVNIIEGESHVTTSGSMTFHVLPFTKRQTTNMNIKIGPEDTIYIRPYLNMVRTLTEFVAYSPVGTKLEHYVFLDSTPEYVTTIRSGTPHIFTSFAGENYSDIVGNPITTINTGTLQLVSPVGTHYINFVGDPIRTYVHQTTLESLMTYGMALNIYSNTSLKHVTLGSDKNMLYYKDDDTFETSCDIDPDNVIYLHGDKKKSNSYNFLGVNGTTNVSHITLSSSSAFFEGQTSEAYIRRFRRDPENYGDDEQPYAILKAQVTTLSSTPITYEDGKYVQVEYIESDGKNFIDTRVIGKSGLKTEMKAQILNDSDSNLLAARKNSNRFYIPACYSTINIGYGNYYYSTRKRSDAPENIVTILSKGEQSITIDGETIYTNTLTTEIDTSLPLFMFSCNYNGNSVCGATARMYYCKISQTDGTLLRDYVPVMNNDTGDYGMWDKVTNRFYSRVTGDNFKGGDVVEEINNTSSQFTKEYKFNSDVLNIKTGGYSYIDSGNDVVPDAKVYVNATPKKTYENGRYIQCDYIHNEGKQIIALSVTMGEILGKALDNEEDPQDGMIIEADIAIQSKDYSSDHFLWGIRTYSPYSPDDECYPLNDAPMTFGTSYYSTGSALYQMGPYKYADSTVPSSGLYLNINNEINNKTRFIFRTHIDGFNDINTNEVYVEEKTLKYDTREQIRKLEKTIRFPEKWIKNNLWHRNPNLFAIKNYTVGNVDNSGAYYYCDLNFYGLRIYNDPNNELIWEIVPAYDTEEDIFGVYDTTYNRFYKFRKQSSSKNDDPDIERFIGDFDESVEYNNVTDIYDWDMLQGRIWNGVEAPYITSEYVDKELSVNTNNGWEVKEGDDIWIKSPVLPLADIMSFNNDGYELKNIFPPAVYSGDYNKGKQGNIRVNTFTPLFGGICMIPLRTPNTSSYTYVSYFTIHNAEFLDKVYQSFGTYAGTDNELHKMPDDTLQLYSENADGSRTYKVTLYKDKLDIRRPIQIWFKPKVDLSSQFPDTQGYGALMFVTEKTVSPYMILVGVNEKYEEDIESNYGYHPVDWFYRNNSISGRFLYLSQDEYSDGTLSTNLSKLIIGNVRDVDSSGLYNKISYWRYENDRYNITSLASMWTTSLPVNMSQTLHAPEYVISSNTKYPSSIISGNLRAFTNYDDIDEKLSIDIVCDEKYAYNNEYQYKGYHPTSTLFIEFNSFYNIARKSLIQHYNNASCISYWTVTVTKAYKSSWAFGSQDSGLTRQPYVNNVGYIVTAVPSREELVQTKTNLNYTPYRTNTSSTNIADALIITDLSTMLGYNDYTNIELCIANNTNTRRGLYIVLPNQIDTATNYGPIYDINSTICGWVSSVGSESSNMGNFGYTRIKKFDQIYIYPTLSTCGYFMPNTRSFYRSNTSRINLLVSYDMWNHDYVD